MNSYIESSILNHVPFADKIRMVLAKYHVKNYSLLSRVCDHLDRDEGAEMKVSY